MKTKEKNRERERESERERERERAREGEGGRESGQMEEAMSMTKKELRVGMMEAVSAEMMVCSDRTWWGRGRVEMLLGDGGVKREGREVERGSDWR